MCFYHGGCIKHQRSNPLLLDTLNESRATCTRLEDTSALRQDVQEVARLSMPILQSILALRGSSQASELSVSFSSRACNLDFGKAKRPKCQFPLLANDLTPFEVGANICLLVGHVVYMNRQGFLQQPCLMFSVLRPFVYRDMRKNVHQVEG